MINVKLLGSMSQVDKASSRFCNKKKPNIIISTEYDHSLLKKKLKFEYIPITIYGKDTHSIKKLSNQLKKISSNTIYSHKVEIYNHKRKTLQTLIKLKFNPHLCGTDYLLDCIIALKENPYSRVTYKNIKSNIKNIATKYSMPTQSIICDLRASIEEMYNLTSSDFRNKIYGTDAYLDYPKIVKTIYLL